MIDLHEIFISTKGNKYYSSIECSWYIATLTNNIIFFTENDVTKTYLNNF